MNSEMFSYSWILIGNTSKPHRRNISHEIWVHPKRNRNM